MPTAVYGRGAVVQGSASGMPALIDAARAGDREAFAALYRLTVTRVYRYAAARVRTIEEAEELTQEVYLSALSGVHGLRARSEAELLGWLLQIARRRLADHLRRRYRRPADPLDASAEPSDAAPLPEDQIAAVEARAEVRDALAALTADQREVVTCKYVLELTNEETARMMGKNANAVNQLHHRALRRLERVLRAREAAP